MGTEEKAGVGWAGRHPDRTTVASQLLCLCTHWNPPKVADDSIVWPAWVETPLTQLRSGLGKVDTGVIKTCCDLYLMPNPTPKPKTKRYDLIIQQFRARSLYLLSLLNIDFAKDFASFFPQILPDATTGGRGGVTQQAN